MRSEAIGCVMSIQPALWRSRTWWRARTARIYTSTPSNHFIPVKNFWCGTATNLHGAAITLHWLNWLLITQVCLCVILGHLKKVQNFFERSTCLHFYATHPGEVPKSKRQPTDKIFCVAVVKNYSVTPTALLWKARHKGADRSPENREGLSPASAALFGKDDTNFGTLDNISISLFHSQQNCNSYLFDTPSSLHSFTNTKGAHASRETTYSLIRTCAHTRGRLRCWQRSGMTPLFIWLLRRKSVRKPSSVTTWTSWQDDPLTDWYLTECWLFVC